jgi:hypothetical protein
LPVDSVSLPELFLQHNLLFNRSLPGHLLVARRRDKNNRMRKWCGTISTAAIPSAACAKFAKSELLK